MWRGLSFLFVLLGLVLAKPEIAAAQVSAPPPQGVAVLGATGAKDDAFALARAVYASGLRPRTLDEMRARILAGEQPTAGTKDLKDLADLRASINGEDVASKRLLASIAMQFNLQAILVVSRASHEKAPADAPPPDADAGPAAAPAPAAGPVATTASARLFVAATGDFDAARYEPADGWNATVASVVARFPPPPPPPPAVALPAPQLPKVPQEKREDRPFYKSPWLWGALAAAAVIGGIFFFASQDKSSSPIHVRMTVP